MGKSKPDNWDRPRLQGQHLDKADHDYILKSFHAGIEAKVVARKLKCASRTIRVHYSRYRGDVPEHEAEPVPPPPLKRADYTARLYKPNFDL